MRAFSPYDSRFLWFVMMYGLVAACWNLGHGSVTHDEAISIFMGRETLSGQACPLCAQTTGSVMVHPVLSALGDKIAGLDGARAVGTLCGLGLTWTLYHIARILFSKKLALLSATFLLFTGTTVYLSTLATYDIIAAFFLSLSFLLILFSEKGRSPLWLFAGAIALFIASITKYTVAIYLLPIMLYALWRHKTSTALMYFVLPLVISVLAYVYLALFPVWGYISGSATGLYKEGRLPMSVLAGRVLQWMALPYLLAVFGLFHKEWGKTALLLVVLSAPVILLHLISGDGRSINKNVIFAIVFLTPASALGVDHMGTIFSSNISGEWIKPFFTVAVLAITWVVGVQQFRWLEQQFPDITPVVSFFKQKGFDGMEVVIDSRYGEPEYLYRYYLEKTFPRARFLSMSHINYREQADLLEKGDPDFLMADEYYGGKSFREAAMRQLEKGYYLVREFKLPLAWGVEEIKIFQRRKV
jgi:hypothetical protein